MSSIINDSSLKNKPTTKKTNITEQQEESVLSSRNLKESYDTEASYSSLKTSSIKLNINTNTNNANLETSSLNTAAKKNYNKNNKNEILKSIECIISYNFFESILLIICSLILKFLLSEKKDSFPIACMLLSFSFFILNITLITAIKFGFSNNPNDLKLFRSLLIIEFLLLLTNFSFQILGGVLNFLNSGKNFTFLQIFFYSLLGISFVLFIVSVIQGFKICVESFLILIGNKKEYSKLFLDENERLIYYERENYNKFKVDGKLLMKEDNEDKINPLYNKFHNSLRRDRNDDLFYRKIQ